MTTLVFFVLSMFAAPPLPGECVTVQAAQSSLGNMFQPSSGNIRIVASFNAHPAKRATLLVVAVTFAADPGTVLYTVSADDQGVAKLPQLSPGNYRVETWLGVGASDDLYLSVSNQNDPVSYSMELLSLSIEQRLLARFESSRRETSVQVVQNFVGVVKDESGAAIPGASIDIWKADTQEKPLVGRNTSDRDGHFSVNLAPGKYVAIMQESGFRAEILPFEVQDSPQSRGASMVVTMRVQSC